MSVELQRLSLHSVVSAELPALGHDQECDWNNRIAPQSRHNNNSWKYRQLFPCIREVHLNGKLATQGARVVSAATGGVLIDDITDVELLINL